MRNVPVGAQIVILSRTGDPGSLEGKPLSPVFIEEHVAKEVQSWGEWAQVPLNELVNRICRQWLADQEQRLGNFEQAEEWRDEA